MASTPQRTRRACSRTLIAALCLALIALPAQARADSKDAPQEQSGAIPSTAAQSEQGEQPSDLLGPTPTGAPHDNGANGNGCCTDTLPKFYCKT